MTARALKQTSAPDARDNQRAASNPAASVWVNASAGAGKTKVLTDRVTRLLLAGVLPQKILCLTYTRAGAAEMANRITATLSKWASCDDTALDQDLDNLQNAPPTAKQRLEARRLFARVLACPGGLRIRTIHAFCQEILSRFPIEAGLPPHFALIDEQELEAMQNEVLDDLLCDAAEHPEQDMARALSVLVAAQGEHGFGKMLHDAIRERGRLADAVRQAGGEKKLIAKMRARLLLGPADTPESLRAAAMGAMPEKDIRQMAAWLSEGGNKNQARGKTLAAILALPRDGRSGKFDAYAGIFLTAENEPRKGRDLAIGDLRAAHPEIDELSTREATRLRSTLERIEAATIAQLTESVLAFAGAFAQRLAARKAARAALDYDDLIHFTEALLRRRGISPWILYKLDNGIDHILVDEAQDTSRAQWNIVEALTAEFYAGEGAEADKNRTLFVVGDEKQSIFSFQNADPEAFRSFRDIFARRFGDAGKTMERVPLHISFRSAPAILRAVDAIFANPAARQGVSHEPVEHSAAKEGGDKIGRVEIWPLLQAAKNETKSDGTWILPTGYEEEEDPQAELARQIAQKIKSLWNRNQAQPGDIMILLRRRGRFADLMVRALKAFGVPVTGVDRMHLIKQLPVMDLLAALRFVLLPEDDLNLAALLRGPLLGLSEEQLMELAMGRGGSLWQSLKDKAQSSPAFAAARDYLADRLGEADFSPPFAFLSQLLNAPCPASTVSGRKALWARLGHEALDPIEELLNAAQHFGQRHSPSLQNFLHWLTEADAEIKRELDHGGGQVRIMTVHAAKGLEAPIVFLPDAASVPRATDLAKFQWAGEVPLFLARKPDFAARHLWQGARDRQLEEYRRLFYVALTRAANRLYICGWQGGKADGDSGDSWYNLATAALQPLHQDFLPPDTDGGVAPEIIIGDSGVETRPLEKPVAARQPENPLPAWAMRRAAAQPAIISTAPPSQGAATPDAAFARGRIIHRLLQSLPDIAAEKRGGAVTRFLSHPRHNLTPAERDEIAGEVGKLLADEKFASLFGPGSSSEVRLTGIIGGSGVLRQIDRLCVRDDEIWVVDYKTNRPPPSTPADIPENYRAQLAEYRLLLSGIYPGKRIQCFLLWTYTAQLMKIDF